MPFNGFPKPKKDGKNLSPIKRKQWGEATIATSTLQTDIPITAVNLAKAVVYVSSSGGTYAEDMLVKGSLTSDTNLRISRNTASASVTTNVSWQVIEYNNVKSLQKGTTSVAVGSEVTTGVSSVDVSKSILVISFTDPATTASTGSAMCKSRIIDASNIGFNAAAGTHSVSWQLIEFY